MTWILPKQLISAFAQDTEALTSDSAELSRICEQSLMRRSKHSPAKNLLARMEGGQLDAAPIWSDLKSFPWKEFSGLVDILSGGYPCQPFSAAGKRLGTEDPRHLWPYIAEGIRLLRPRICFFENVEGHISLGLREVIGELEELGYQTTFGIFSASECGAPHQRKRVFILAIASGLGGETGLSGEKSRYEGQSGESDDGGGEVMADSECSRSSTGRSDARRQEVSQSEHCNLWPSRPGEQQYSWEPPRVVAHSDTGTRSPKHEQQASSKRGETAERATTQPIGSSTMADSNRIDRSAQAEGREHDRQAGSAGEAVVADTSIIGGDRRSDGSSGRIWQPGEVSFNAAGCGGQGNGMRQTQPSLGRNPDGSASGLDYAQLCVTCDNRTDELRLLGNGVVPATAERAFRTLIAELFPQ